MKVAGVFISNSDRVFYQEQGITKYALASYYDAVASLMVPHVADRPLVLVRCIRSGVRKRTEQPGS